MCLWIFNQTGSTTILKTQLKAHLKLVLNEQC